MAVYSVFSSVVRMIATWSVRLDSHRSIIRCHRIGMTWMRIILSVVSSFVSSDASAVLSVVPCLPKSPSDESVQLRSVDFTTHFHKTVMILSSRESKGDRFPRDDDCNNTSPDASRNTLTCPRVESDADFVARLLIRTPQIANGQQA